MAIGLREKIAIVTGASRGLGLAIAKQFAGEGATTVICSNSKEIERACSEIKGFGGNCEGFVVDVSKEKSVDDFINKIIKKYGRADILVNNAGWAGDKKAPIEKWDIDDYRKIMATNADSVFYFLRKIAPVFKKQKSGLIINISSGAGKRGHGELAAYSASKFAVMGLTQSVAWELEGSGAKCVAVCPAGINTDMREKLFGNEDSARQQSPEALAKIISQIATGEIEISNGGDIFVKNGQVLEISNPLNL